MNEISRMNVIPYQSTCGAIANQLTTCTPWYSYSAFAHFASPHHPFARLANNTRAAQPYQKPFNDFMTSRKYSESAVFLSAFNSSDLRLNAAGPESSTRVSSNLYKNGQNVDKPLQHQQQWRNGLGLLVTSDSFGSDIQSSLHKPFQLSSDFLRSQEKDGKPCFGFNGLGELVYQRTYARCLRDGSSAKENW